MNTVVMPPSTQRGVESTNNRPDYAAVTIPAKPPSEYTYVERRADLLEQIMSLGHPSMIHQGEQADRFGVSQSQISKDLDRLGEYISENLGKRRDLTTTAVFDRAIRGLLEEGEYRDAARTMAEYNEFLNERKFMDELEERIADLERGADR